MELSTLQRIWLYSRGGRSEVDAEYNVIYMNIEDGMEQAYSIPENEYLETVKRGSNDFISKASLTRIKHALNI